jgi:putative ABC transport system permease protein
MWRLAAHELRGQWRLTTLVACGLLLAALAYVSLLGTASETTTALTGDIGKAWNTPYDLLVRPTGDVSELERTKGLVSPNFVSSIGGGISEAQLGAIRRIKDVSVAAPIAVVGYTTLDYTLEIPNLTTLIGPTSFAVLRIEQTATADDGLSHYPSAPVYVIWAPKGVLTVGSGISAQLSYDGRTIECNGASVQCDAGTIACSTCGGGGGSIASAPTAEITFPIPIMIAGIDPEAESKLAGIGKALTSGHQLPAANAPLKLADSGQATQIPVIVSSKSFVSESVELEADSSLDAPAALTGEPPASLSGWSEVYHTSSSVQSLYTNLLNRRIGLPSDLADVTIPGEVRYDELSPDHLRAATVPTNSKELANPNCLYCATDDIPTDANDTWYRRLEVSTRNPSRYTFFFKTVGEYDPSKIPGFNALAGGNLSAYAPPEARLPDGKELLPNRNVAGFITSPPLALTTLAGAQYFADNFSNGAGVNFISVIRVRVADTAKPSDAAQSRLKAVAQAIEQRTGLSVSLVKGSSALPIRVTLAKGSFGEPSLTVTQYWGKEGAAIIFLHGVNLESLALFLLTLGVVLVLIGVIGQLAARRRRSDFALLRAVGWPQQWVIRLAISEMALLGAGVGVAAAVVAICVTRLLEPSVPILPLLAVIPLVLTMSLAAPLPALWGAARSSAAVELKHSGGIGGLRVRSVPTLALRDLLGPWRMESLLCVASSTIGSALVGGVVLVLGGFSGNLGPTTLGRYLANQVGPLDIVMVVIAILAGTGTSAALLSLAYLERQVEFSTLRAVGWPRGAVVLVVTIQALTLGVGGGLVSALLVTAGAISISAPVATTVTAPLVALTVALAAAVIGMQGTIWLAYRLQPAASLRSA